MRYLSFLALAVCFLLAGCGRTSPPEAGKPSKSEAPKQAGGDRADLRRALGNIQAYLSDLEGRLRVSQAETWAHEASAAQHDLGNIRLELTTLRDASVNPAALEGLLSELEGKLRGASQDNWNPDASAARDLVGSIRLELQNLSRGL